VLVGLIISFGMNKVVVRPLLLLNSVIQDEIDGKPQKEKLNDIKNKDEIGKLTNNFKEMMNKLDTQMENISKANKALETSSEEDRQRKWIAEGVSSFVDLMKNTNEDINEIAYKIISKMVKYIDANQGGIFFIEDLENAEKMHLAASFAYNRRKFFDKDVIKGEGLIGAAWIERQTVILSDIPQDYISISSGLGDAKPDKLIIVPIKNEDALFGVIEIASFKEFKAHEVELLEKTCQRIATTFESMKTQERTRNLLQTSQQQAEELKAQEEEMRQNLEEMAATQEDYSRRETELNQTIANLAEENKELKNLLKTNKAYITR
jgi:GAF domain-containing protein/HAMP domain-containing protein